MSHFVLDSSDLQILGGPPDYAHIVNAWVLGIVNLPEPYRRTLTAVLLKHLEDWILERSDKSPDEILAAFREAICDSVGGKVARPSREHEVPSTREMDRNYGKRDHKPAKANR